MKKNNVISLNGMEYEICGEKQLRYCPYCHYSHYIYELKRTYEISIQNYRIISVPRMTYYCTASGGFFRSSIQKFAERDFLLTNITDETLFKEYSELNFAEVD